MEEFQARILNTFLESQRIVGRDRSRYCSIRPQTRGGRLCRVSGRLVGNLGKRRKFRGPVNQRGKCAAMVGADLQIILKIADSLLPLNHRWTFRYVHPNYDLASTAPSKPRQSRVPQILWEDTRAAVIELKTGGQLRATGEFVLCAGTIETPRLMQLSGLGHATHPGNHGIDVVAELPGVGENCQDHLEANVPCYTKRPISLNRQDKSPRGFWHLAQYQLLKTGLLSSNLVECDGFVDMYYTGLPNTKDTALFDSGGVSDPADL